MELSQISDLIKSSKVVERKTSDLIPYARNSRTHSDLQISQIISSIKSFGFTNPVLIAEDGTIIAGHGRTIAAHKMGLETLPCVVLSHLSETDRRALTIADNQIALNSSWDKELLGIEIKDLKLQSFDVGILGFEQTELINFLAEDTKTNPEPEQKSKEDDDNEKSDALPTKLDRRVNKGETFDLDGSKVFIGDCLEFLKTLEADSVDSLVSDPPAGIAFMNKEWDEDKGGRDEWIAWLTEIMKECLRVLKPGAHGLVWALPRTSHWTATALENAGFEVRDVVTHLFGTGFPKSIDISKAIDKAAGAEREVIGSMEQTNLKGGSYGSKQEKTVVTFTTPSTHEAKQWQGWGTALKPAQEAWILVRKPCSEKTVAANVLKHGVGGINIDASRIGCEPFGTTMGKNALQTGNRLLVDETSGSRTGLNHDWKSNPQGRFPANLVLSHNSDCIQTGTKTVKAAGGDINSVAGTQRQSMGAMPDERNFKAYGNGDGTETVAEWQCSDGCAVKALDEQSGELGKSVGGNSKNINNKIYGKYADKADKKPCGFGDSGGASRFFYVAKASRSDKGEDNIHPTVKSTSLMRYLIRLITPPNGVILDAFLGSGTTLIAAEQLGFKCLGAEMDEVHGDIILSRYETFTGKKAVKIESSNSPSDQTA